MMPPRLLINADYVASVMYKLLGFLQNRVFGTTTRSMQFEAIFPSLRIMIRLSVIAESTQMRFSEGTGAEVRIPIHREGWPFIGFFFVANLLLFPISIWLGWAFVPLTLWCIAFFRDPERLTPLGEGLITSPADGRLLPVVHAIPPRELGMGAEPRVRLSIFMDVFDVHVNRVPLDGKVVALSYRKGRFINASFDKASEQNERMSARIHIEGMGDAADLAVVQIAGLVARRIKCDLVQGEKVQRGERFGIIRFGSRLDVYLPPGTQVLAVPNQRVKAGETVLASFQ